MPRAITSAPSYLLAVAVMTIIGVMAAGTLANTLLPLGAQKAYLGGAIRYSVDVGDGEVVVQVINDKPYNAKIDVVLVTGNNQLLTACESGAIASSAGTTVYDSGFSLVGLEVQANDVLTITCRTSSQVRDAVVYEYGVPGSKPVEATVNLLAQGVEFRKASVDKLTEAAAKYRYWLPVTVFAVTEYPDGAVIAVDLWHRTLPPDIWSFVKKTMTDLNTVAVIDEKGNFYPTLAKRSENKIVVKFKVDELSSGVHRFYILFGKKGDFTPPRLSEGAEPDIYTPKRFPLVIYWSMAYPAYLVPEANWLPRPDDEVTHRIYVIDEEDDFLEVRDAFREGDLDEIEDVIEDATRLAPFPIGTENYKHWMKPKTDLGEAPWAVVTVVPLPIPKPPKGLGVKAALLVSSDDGSGAYIAAYGKDSVVLRIYSNELKAHRAHYWNYRAHSISVPVADKNALYLVILSQNGICEPDYYEGMMVDACAHSGGGKGYLDFRFAMWYVSLGPEKKTPLEPDDWDELEQPGTVKSGNVWPKSAEKEHRGHGPRHHRR